MALFALMENQSPKSESTGRRRLAIIAAFVLIGLCSFLAFFEIPHRLGLGEEDEWVATTDAFMLAMVNKDLNRAYALLSEEFKDEVSVSELEVFGDRWFVWFDGYLEMEISSSEINSTRGGRVADIYADITYEGGYPGTLEATLEEEADEWKIRFWNINVPSEKIDEYETRNQ